jgi:cystathionine gamma-lyase
VKFDTRAVHVGTGADEQTGAVIPPLYLASTYDQRGIDQPRYFYGRGENPTREALEQLLASLDQARYALAFSSGQAAGMAVLAMLKPGDVILSVDDIYGGTYNLFRVFASSSGIETDYSDLTDAAAFERALRPETRLVWIETPTNPLLKVIDIARICEVAHRRGVQVLVDNTFCSPYLQSPLELGADLVLYSTTKYIGGHLDVIGGSLAYNREELHQKLSFFRTAAGSVPSPFDCWLIQRGAKTLGLRMDRQVDNALKIVEFLRASPHVSRVFYPGLESHPQHEVAKRQMRRPGAIISFEYEGNAGAFLQNLQLFAYAVSLGGVMSLIECPAQMTHRPIPREKRLALGIKDNLIRISAGIENAEDLIADLAKGMRHGGQG